MPPSGEAVYQRMLQSAVWILAVSRDEGSHGSGAVIDKDQRLIITNHHVVKGADVIAVVFPAFEKGRLITENAYYLDEIKKNKRFERGTVVKMDARRDLALVQLGKLPDAAVAIPPANQSPLPGQQIWSLGGNPKGSSGQWILGSGTVRQVSFKEYKTDSGDRAALMIESQVPINSGDSGGPVVDARGQLVGINVSVNVVSTLNSSHIDVTEVVDFVKAYFRSLGKTWSPAPVAPTDTGPTTTSPDTVRMVKDLHQGSAEERLKAAQTLRAQGPQVRGAVPDLLKVLRDPKTPDPVMREASLALAAIGPPQEIDVAVLAEALADRECLPARAYASDALARLGPAARPAFKPLANAAASDPAPEVRRLAVAALGKLGPSARQDTQPVFLQLLRDSDREVRAAAERGLVEACPPVGTFLPDSPLSLDLTAEAVPCLTAALGSTSSTVRSFTAYALGTLKEQAAPAATALAQAAAREKEFDARMEMLWALCEIGPPAASAAPKLKDIINDPTCSLNEVAFAALALHRLDPQTGSSLALPALARVLRVPGKNSHPNSSEVRRRAISELSRSGKPAAEALVLAVPNVLRGDTDEAIAGRVIALQLIEKMGPPVYSPELAAKLRGVSNNRGEDPEVRTAARRALDAVQK